MNNIPWWVDPAPEDETHSNKNTPYENEEYSVDNSMYIDDDDDDDDEGEDDDDSDDADADDAYSHTNVIPDYYYEEEPPPFPAQKAKAATATEELPTSSSSSSSTRSPARKSLQDLSTKLSKSTAKLSKSLSEQWHKSISTIRSSPDRSKSSSSSSNNNNISNKKIAAARRSTMESNKRQKDDAELLMVSATTPASKEKQHHEEQRQQDQSSRQKFAIGKSLSQLGKKAMASFGTTNTAVAGSTISQNHQNQERTRSVSLTDADVTQRESSRSSSARSARSSIGSTSNISNDNNSNNNHNNSGSSQTSGAFRRYTVKELIHSLGRPDIDLPHALERRVRDFKFAQGKRRERHGDNKPWGIFGLYAHLSDIRADLEWAEDAAWRRQRTEPYLSWSDFEKSRDKGLRNRPWFTYGIIAMCSIMLVVSIGVNGWKFEPLNVNPLIGPSSETLIKVGARQTNLIVNEGQWFRLFTPMVLHAGLVHFFMNMAAMYFIGGAIEQSHGFATAAVLFVVPAVGGNIISAICLPQYISVGASGGIFGLIGGCLADISINWNLLFLKSTTDEESRWRHFMVLFWLASDIILNCIIGFTPFVDNFTHLGGFLYGLCCGLSTMDRLAVGFFGLRASDNYSKACNTFMRFFGLIVSVISIMVTTVVLVQSDGVTSPCHGCRYISCVPFPPRADDKWWYCDDCDFVTAELFVDGGGSGLYQEIELECPNGDLERIEIAQDGLYERDAIRRALPTYCRNHCEDVFSD